MFKYKIFITIILTLTLTSCSYLETIKGFMGGDENNSGTVTKVGLEVGTTQEVGTTRTSSGRDTNIIKNDSISWKVVLLFILQAITFYALPNTPFRKLKAKVMPNSSVNKEINKGYDILGDIDNTKTRK